MRVFDFEHIDERLDLMPLAARRALDGAGHKLPLAGWRTLPLEARRRLVELGSEEAVDGSAVLAAVEPAQETLSPIDAADVSPAQPPKDATPTVADAWPSLSALARFALRHVYLRGQHDRIAAAVAEIVAEAPPSDPNPSGLTHIDGAGAASMVDVAAKAITVRRAVARARLRMRPASAAMVRDHSGPKGDVLQVARIAGIMAAKRTPELIPLCHGIALTKVRVTFEVEAEAGVVTVTAEAIARDRTGVEMEAMVAASVASLTVYDMLKAVDRAIAIEEVVLMEKEGGRSGHYVRS